MTEDKNPGIARLTSAVSRREVLKGGLIAGSAAFLAACGALHAPSAAPVTAAPHRGPTPPRRRPRCHARPPLQRRPDAGAR